MGTPSSILAWRIPWTREPAGLQSTGLKRVEHMSPHVHAESFQSCPTLCDAMDCTPPGPLFISFSRDLCNPVSKPASPALQADFLLTELPGKPIEAEKELKSQEFRFIL